MEIGAASTQSVNLPESVRRAGTPSSAAPAASNAAPKPPPEAAPRPVPSEVIDALAARTEANTRSASRIRLDEATDRVVVQILNSDNEVIKQFPPEELLDVLKQIRHVTGLILDRQV